MSKLFVSPSADTDWRIGAADFEARLRARWPEAHAQVMTLEGIEGELEFSVPPGDAPLAGVLQADGKAMSLDGELPDCAELAAWFREQVPPEQELILWDGGGSVVVPLEPGVAAEEIERRTREQWRS